MEVPACGTTVTITAGDVRDVEERTRTLATGGTLTEFRGGATVDLVSPTSSPAPAPWPTGEPADIAGFEAAGLPLLGYFSDPEQTVELELRVDAETGDLIETEIDADIVDLCPLVV
ncbi:hypothetical protein [Blastococcus sp. URHD0036]|uniref:hypothetical protein n=1 Tax=Blastococcus sp. URHD0036 TaxID=1380356 RepID=UPI00049856D7|nr:hypothetical protein [Blastococcus sp. URHD0036]